MLPSRLLLAAACLAGLLAATTAELTSAGSQHETAAQHDLLMDHEPMAVLAFLLMVICV